MDAIFFLIFINLDQVNLRCLRFFRLSRVGESDWTMMWYCWCWLLILSAAYFLFLRSVKSVSYHASLYCGTALLKWFLCVVSWKNFFSGWRDEFQVSTAMIYTKMLASRILNIAFWDHIYFCGYNVISVNNGKDEKSCMWLV